MKRYTFLVPIEAEDNDDAWVKFWDLVAEGCSESWDDIDVDFAVQGGPLEQDRLLSHR
jgi:hypothetical protein